jgi:hypothetical protein
MTERISILLLVLTFLSACEVTDQRREEDINSDMINVPVSADGMIDTDLPSFEFENMSFEFGVISQGEKVSHSYRFKNNGKSDLIIAKVEGSCGCTVLKGWPKHPVKPGEMGKIDMIFDSNGRRGVQNKTVSIIANTYPSTTVLTIKGEVKAPK